MDDLTLHVIARMHSDFPSKFGIPRQSGMVAGLQSTIVFEPAYRAAEAFRGMDAFSHLWLLWGFSATGQADWSPTVRPPVLGGNTRVGVFATRSPYRPNPLALSSVRLAHIEQHPQLGIVLYVTGADLMHGSPIYDIKPYLAFTDSHPDASGGFTTQSVRTPLQVDIPAPWRDMIPPAQLDALTGVLAHDPRPSYQDDPGRRYGMEYAGLEIKFTVRDGTLTVCRVEPIAPR